ncbi:hypothetical protein [Arthrobacter sp. Soil762]|uniref:hypothetical protein n=1 Tax=Arthrobacter sp. Soil762 TaxID=1736401 RepID=UPI0006F9C71A|nr:hypothetical protein [Arthrobacter sp. Soil762]KRE71653.1 hypothetical protein ASG77_11585 [Arthrobacter sp. Soil762]
MSSMPASLGWRPRPAPVDRVAFVAPWILAGFSGCGPVVACERSPKFLVAVAMGTETVRLPAGTAARRPLRTVFS